MQYILFGAGEMGKKALWFLGYERVKCFVDNNRFGNELEMKDIISFSQFQAVYNENYIVVITSEKYHIEMEEQLKGAGIYRYFIFREEDIWKINDVLPWYNLYGKAETVSYTKVLSDNSVKKYKKIAIYGTNNYMQYLISEIAIQTGDISCIKGIISENDDCNPCVDIQCVALDDIYGEIDCLIINTARTESDIRDRIAQRAHSFDLIDIYDSDKFEKSFYYPQLKKFKNIHKGERVFLVGNGPSLRIEDLETLHKHNEICFGFNKIYQIYNKTGWRANYFAITDACMLSNCCNDINSISADIFIGDVFCDGLNNYYNDNVNHIHLKMQEYWPNYPGFSDNICNGVCWGYTVTYDVGLQVAAYMGFSEIYLIGVDNSTVGNVTDDRNHFLKNYYSEQEKRVLKNFDSVLANKKTEKAYEMAEIYSRRHGFRIYNATRGGKLEAFERVDFDKLF